ncbi:MAG: RimK/LysX family protein [Gammaproteobacteria bacterium]|nr:RimK/LysX family protein [Gammaproteobacteria bacterium]
MTRAPLMQSTALLVMMALTAALVAAAGVAGADEAPAILGWVEEVSILDTGLVLPAKIDTGADNSSIHASAISYVTHDGNPWVRFTLRDRAGVEVVMERPLIRLGQIKRKEGGYLERPVVSLGLCVAGQRVTAEVNLADRNHFTYPMLVGRSLMVRRFVVDPNRRYITRPTCAAV